VAEKLKKRRWQSCNVMQVGADARRIWTFDAARKDFNLKSEEMVPAGQSLPEKLVANDWRVLFQSRLNVALLPVDKVFLRVAQLPAGSFDETLAMVELQLEKFSPLPVTQIVWSIHALPGIVDNLQTVIVIIVAREVVQEFIGQLEGQGYLADRLELPLIDQLQATPISGDGAWIYPYGGTADFTGLVAWWYGGLLRNLALLHVPAGGNRGAVLKEQLAQMTWAGELEGWLISPPRWHLVADDKATADWQTMFLQGLGSYANAATALPPAQLAALTAKRSAQSDPKANLLPPEYSTRYHQQFVDHLWMGGLGAALMVYLAGLLIYFAFLGVQTYRTSTVQGEVKQLSASYTNTLQLKARMQVLQDRQALKYASLDCWKVVAEELPESLTLQGLDFKNGKTLALSGVAPADQASLITDFTEHLQKKTVNGQPFFASVDSAPWQRNPGGSTVTWSIRAEIAHGEGE
jgi:hypothetical protein